jgi:NAD(P)-dependent dehydrogenase (short-subunit alcohol dehydrogenase family)
LYIVTGASRGIGAALAGQLLAADHTLLLVSRGTNERLERESAARDIRLEQWQLDLAHGEAAAARLEAWLRRFDAAAFASATLINNAGAISRVGALDDDDGAAVARALRVGLEAPVLLMQAFLRATRHWKARRRILNVSSGAGRNAIAGWATYCAAKAGLDHATRVVALDEARRPNGAKVVSLAPGVVDTQMQGQLRTADPAGFPDQQRFLDLYNKGELTSAEDAAKKVLAWLARPDFGDKPVADVRDA